MKVVNDLSLNNALDGIGNVLREKLGTSNKYSFPYGFIDAVNSICSYSGQFLSVIPNGSREILDPSSDYDAISGIYVEGDGYLLEENIRYGATIFSIFGDNDGGLRAIRNRTIEKFGAPISNISDYTFYKCSKLSEISFSECLTIGVNAFALCSSLYSAIFPVCSYIGNSAFMSCSSLSLISFPNCKAIGESAFYKCSAIQNFALPSCEEICPNAFEQCYSLSEISIPLCSSIGSYAFSNCVGIRSIENSIITELQEGVFANCSSLESVSFAECILAGRSNYPQSSSNGTFYRCSNLEIVSLPKIQSLGVNVFYGCSKISSINIPACSFIGGNAFNGCTNLEEINGPFTFISGSAFKACYKLTRINSSIPGVADIGICSSVKGGAFWGARSIEEIKYPLCTGIEISTFMNCSILKRINSSIDGHINFPLCSYLSSYAFSECSMITTASFPMLNNIGSLAFYRCYTLLSLYLLSSVLTTLTTSYAFVSTPIAGYTEYVSGSYGTIYVPSSLYSQYISATNWSYFSSRIASYVF